MQGDRQWIIHWITGIMQYAVGRSCHASVRLYMSAVVAVGERNNKVAFHCWPQCCLPWLSLWWVGARRCWHDIVVLSLITVSDTTLWPWWHVQWLSNTCYSQCQQSVSFTADDRLTNFWFTALIRTALLHILGHLLIFSNAGCMIWKVRVEC